MHSNVDTSHIMTDDEIQNEMHKNKKRDDDDQMTNVSLVLCAGW